MAVAKRKPQPANRRARRALGLRSANTKPKPPSGDDVVETLRHLVRDNDASVTESRGLIMGESGWTFHRDGRFAYAVTRGKTRISLHAMPMYCNPEIHAAYAKRVRGANFGKGCIRLKLDAEVDRDILGEFIRACARAPLG